MRIDRLGFFKVVINAGTFVVPEALGNKIM